MECIFYDLLHFESLVKCKLYPKSTPVIVQEARTYSPTGFHGAWGGGKGGGREPKLAANKPVERFWT